MHNTRPIHYNGALAGEEIKDETTKKKENQARDADQETKKMSSYKFNKHKKEDPGTQHSATVSLAFNARNEMMEERRKEDTETASCLREEEERRGLRL